MSGILNLFKNLFSGIFGFLGGLFKGKSNDGFYLELKDDTAAAKPVTTATVAMADAPAAVKSKSTRAEKLTALAAEGQGESAAVAAAPMTTAAALNLPQPTVTQAPKEPEIKTFADSFLLPLATPIRRPGANMSSFLDMARKVNRDPRLG